MVSFDAITNGLITAATSKTISHTVSGINRIVFVALHLGDVTGVSCTYGGVAMTLVASNTSAPNRDTYLFYLINPPLGAANAVASWTGASGGYMSVKSYNGVHQTAPLGTAVNAYGNNTTPTVTVSGLNDSLIIDAVMSDNTLTVGAGQTERLNYPGSFSIGGSEENGGSNIVMSWSQASGNWSIVAVPVNPAATTDYLTNYRPRKRTAGLVSV